MSSNYGPGQGPGASAGPKPLSCVNCRQRKVKCNKISPCNHCEKSGIRCVFPNRVRVARDKKNASKTRDSELLQRIARLESLVSKVDTAGKLNDNNSREATISESSPQTATSFSPPSNQASEGGSAPVGIDEVYGSFVKLQTQSTNYLSGEFWTSLCDEVDGLRQLLDGSGDDDDDDPSDSLSYSTGTSSSPQQFIFNEPNTWMDREVSYPSDAHRDILFDIYFANVDPICKMLHKPTAKAHVVASQELLSDATGRYKYGSLEAASFAMYYTAVTSLSREQCVRHFSEDKDVLLARYKRGTEIGLARADFMNSMEMVTLQALVLYIVAIRSQDNSRSSWTLIGLAVRIAHGLGLHKDGEGRHLYAFHAEMRRRLWWVILVLDMKASEDRGCEPMILENSFNTKRPRNINDEQMSFSSQHPIADNAGFTEMSFCLISMDVSNTARKINFVPLAQKEHQPLTIEQKEELVKECTHRIETIYVASYDPNDDKNWVPYMISRLLILKLWLITQYPLQSRQTTSQHFPREQSLRTVVSYLEITEIIETGDRAAGFSWYFKTYVPWHAVAVALAELCNEPKGPLADKAWAIIDRNYDNWGNRVADSKEGLLWRPVKSLLKRARAARERAQKANEPPQAITQLPVLQNDSLIPEMPFLSLQPIQVSPYNSVAMDDISHMDQNSYVPFSNDWLSYDGINLPSNEPYEDMMNWTDWNEFILDINAAGSGFSPKQF